MAKVSDSSEMSPRVMETESGGDESSENSSGKVRMKKELGLFDGVNMIVGVIIGSGIFISPNFVLKYTGSIGLSIIIWGLCGIISTIGALCYAELGTMIPKSGADYAYINEAFGPLPAFLYLWVALFVLVPAGNAITAITFAQNITGLVPGCVPDISVRLIAAVVTCLLTFINCLHVKWVTRIQDAFTSGKIVALIIIFISSLVYLGQGNTANLSEPMAGTSTDIGKLAIAFHSGLFSYSGWNFLNFVTEEIKDPYRNLPRGIMISMPIVTTVYVLTNFAYFAVLTKSEIINSSAVALTFSDKILGSWSWTMPLFVAAACFGSLNGAIFASARLFFVGARDGHLPVAISLIDIRRFTPVPSLIFMCIVTLALLSVDQVEELLVSMSFMESLFILTSVAGLLWLRYKQPDLKRPIKVNILLPILFLCVCTFLVTFPIINKPNVILLGVSFVLVGVIVYFVGIRWTSKPKWLCNIFVSLNLVCAKLFMCLPESSKEL